MANPKMSRRLIAAIGTLALVLTVLPVMPDSASWALDCCNGIMCPMHAAESHAANCDADRNGSAALKPCPVQAAVHYMATIAFVLVAPMFLNHDFVIEPAIAFMPNFHSDAERQVDSPPPRLLLTA